MGLMIAGIRITDVQISPKEEKDEMSGHYALMSSEGKILAKQSFGDSMYGDSVIKPEYSRATMDAFRDFMRNLKTDVENTLGIKAE